MQIVLQPLFLSQLIWPVCEMSGRISPEELAERFDISISAARIRCKELERLRRQENGDLRPLPSFALEFLMEAKGRGHKIDSLDI